jgi:DNA mismatch repair ATPase MutS
MAAVEDATLAVLQAEDQVLRAHAEQVSGQLAALSVAVTWLAATDLELQRYRFIATYQACVPVISRDFDLLLDEAQLLPLAQELGAEYVPVSIGISSCTVLVGPNMGGKSSALLTVGFMAMLARRGLPVPAKAARIPLFVDILELAADDTNGGLSAFGQELVALLAVLQPARAQRLILVDEFARTTGVREAKALLIAVAARFVADRNLVLIATHVDGIASSIGAQQYRVAGIREEIERREGEPLEQLLKRLGQALDRRIVLDENRYAPNSSAFSIAQAFGLDAAVLDAARRSYADDHA